MCHVIHVSTTSLEDFLQLPTDHYRFEQPDEATDKESLGLLKHPNKWYLSGRHGGCSCHFRHFHGFGLVSDFWPPKDWYPEDDDEIEATAAVYDVFARIVAEGHQLDMLDTWNDEGLDSVVSISVSLSQVPRESFRFFENYRFEMVP